MATNVAEVRLGDLFVREGLIDANQLKGALQDAKEGGTRVGYSLVKLGFVGENELTRMLSKQYRLPAVDLEKVDVDAKILKLIDGDMAYKHLVLPLRRVGRTLTVAMANPSEMEAIDVLRFKTRYDIEPVIVGEYTLRKHLERYYGVSEEAVDDLLGDFLGDFLEEDLEFVEEEDEEDNVAALQAEVDAAPVVKFINGLLTDAVRKGVSDIHIEPYEKEIRVRYRMDGNLYEVMKPPMKMKAALVSRIKILSDLNIAERRVPQDGRIKLRMKRKVVDFRVSTLPVIFGEKIVMRLIDSTTEPLRLADLGYDPACAKLFEQALRREPMACIFEGLCCLLFTAHIYLLQLLATAS